MHYLIGLISAVAMLDGEPNYEQVKLIDNTKQILALAASTGGTWN